MAVTANCEAAVVADFKPIASGGDSSVQNCEFHDPFVQPATLRKIRRVCWIFSVPPGMMASLESFPQCSPATHRL